MHHSSNTRGNHIIYHAIACDMIHSHPTKPQDTVWLMMQQVICRSQIQPETVHLYLSLIFTTLSILEDPSYSQSTWRVDAQKLISCTYNHFMLLFILCSNPPTGVFERRRSTKYYLFILLWFQQWWLQITTLPKLPAISGISHLNTLYHMIQIKTPREH